MAAEDRVSTRANAAFTGYLGESVVRDYLISIGWFPYVEVIGNSPVDLMALSPDCRESLRIQVKCAKPADRSTKHRRRYVQVYRNNSSLVLYEDHQFHYLAVVWLPTREIRIPPWPLPGGQRTRVSWSSLEPFRIADWPPHKRYLARLSQNEPAPAPQPGELEFEFDDTQ